MQFINVFFGGKILQNISTIDDNNIHTNSGVHYIDIVNNELLNKMKNKEKIEVNSYHNDGILQNMLAKDLQSFSN